MVLIKEVFAGSYADKAGIKSGDTLVSVNSHAIRDVLDYRYRTCTKILEIEAVIAGLKTASVQFESDIASFTERRNEIEKSGSELRSSERELVNDREKISGELARLTERRENMAKECDDLERYINLFGYSPRYGVSGPKISSVKYVPQSYRNKDKLYHLG